MTGRAAMSITEQERKLSQIAKCPAQELQGWDWMAAREGYFATERFAINERAARLGINPATWKHRRD